jgi:hypothetical protein
MFSTLLVALLCSLAITLIPGGQSRPLEERPNSATNSTLHKRASGVTSNSWDAAYQTYDYVVIGGGLTGITVASRLAENPNTQVLIIEAGGDDRFDQRVQNIYTYGQAFGSELDWSWPTDSNRRMTG